MSADFEWSAKTELGVVMRVKMASKRDGRLSLFIEHSAGRYARESYAMATDLPAADARRLRDWLCARYPDTDTGETK